MKAHQLATLLAFLGVLILIGGTLLDH